MLGETMTFLLSHAAAERIGAPNFAGEADGDVFVQHSVDVHI